MPALDHAAPAAAPGSVVQRQLPDWLEVALNVIGVSLIALFLAGFVERNVTHQGDLKTYQLAARVALAGLDPYQPEDLSAMAGRRVFPFVYPPVALVPFLATASLPAKAVAAGWMWAKIALLGVLILAWARSFTRKATLLSVALVATFGWNSSAQWDLAAGNVAIVECGLVWAAFGCFLAGWRTRFALLIVAGACFKLMPATFLLLLLVPTARAGASPKRLAAGLAILAVVVFGPLVVGPAAQFQRFWAHVPDATGYGPANPSALGLATFLAQRVGWSGALAGGVGTAIWVAYAVGLVACSMPLLRDAYRVRDARRWVMTAVFLYVLLLPRPMAYGFLILAPAPLFFSPKPFDSAPGRLLLSLMLASHGMWRLTSIASNSFLVTYAPFLLSLCVWLLVVNEHSTASASASARQGSRGGELGESDALAA
jgi:hypothetical protein